jgi:hypothetical protein
MNDITPRESLLPIALRDEAEGRIAGMRIDERVRELVVVLNSVPQIYTFSSCGGHPEPLLGGQVPSGEFYVCFELEAANEQGFPTPVGWESLRRIAEATLPFFPSVDVTAWDNGGVLNFDIRGGDNVDPDRVAAEIARLVHGAADE